MAEQTIFLVKVEWKEAQKRGLELLAEMPIAMSIRKGADSGLPVVVSEPDSDFAKIYQKLARKVIQKAQLDHGMTMGEKNEFIL